MKLLDIFEEAKAKKAQKVFINPIDTHALLPFPPFPVWQAPNAAKMLSCLGKGGGLYWYEDANIELGTFRVE